MPRYTKQRDHYNCGPVAILNALRWAGINAPYASRIASLERWCRSEPPDQGCSDTNFDRALRRAGSGIFLVRRVYQPLPRDIKAHLGAGEAVILNYGWKDGDRYGRHFSLIVPGSSRAPFRTVNAHTKGPAERDHGFKILREIGYQFQPDERRKGWFLTRAA